MNPPWKPLNQPVGHFHCETRFPDPSWTRDRHQAHILAQQQFFGGSYFLFSPNKPRPLTPEDLSGESPSAYLVSPRSGREWRQVPSRDPV